MLNEIADNDFTRLHIDADAGRVGKLSGAIWQGKAQPEAQ